MKKYTSYLLALSSLGVMLLPLSASAFSLKSALSNTIKLENREGAEVRANVNANVGNNVSSEAKAEAEARTQAKASDKEDNKDNKSEKKEENKNKKENRGFWASWFAKFFNKTDLDIKSAVITRNNATSTTVGWVTNQETKGKVYFGTDASLVTSSSTAGLSFVEDSNFSMDHKTVLTGLSVGTKYYYFIEYQNRAGETARSKVFNFKTKALAVVDAVAPKILFQTTLGVDGDSAQIVWLTNESSDSKVWIGTTVGVNTSGTPTKSSGSSSVFHSLNVGGLATSTKYFYVVSSTDASGNITLSVENSFQTSAE